MEVRIAHVAAWPFSLVLQPSGWPIAPIQRHRVGVDEAEVEGSALTSLVRALTAGPVPGVHRESGTSMLARDVAVPRLSVALPPRTPVSVVAPVALGGSEVMAEAGSTRVEIDGAALEVRWADGHRTQRDLLPADRVRGPGQVAKPAASRRS